MSQVKHICILRLSALGDVSNCLPTLRIIHNQLPATKISWIIGQNEYELVKDIENVNWLVADKTHLFSEWLRLNRYFKANPPDVILHMQTALRASILRSAIKAPRIIGFDKARSKDYQHLFCTEKIPTRDKPHMLETFQDFAKALLLDVSKIEWNFPLDNILLEAADILSELPKKYVVISPCSSKKIRNWTIKGYAEVIDYLFDKYKLPTILTGGTGAEADFIKQITNSSKQNPINLAGKTNIRQMVAVIAKGRFIIAPDSGPGHLGSALGVPVIGLFANTNPERARSYCYPQYVINKYPAAVAKYLGQSINDIKFGARVRDDKVMKLIEPTKVKATIDKLIAAEKCI